MTTIHKETIGTTDFSFQKFDINNLVADAEDERKDSVKDGHFRTLKPGSLECDAKDLPNVCEEKHARYYALRIKEIQKGEFHPTVVKNFDDARRHYNRFIRQRLPANIEKLRQNTTAGGVGIGVIPFMYEVVNGWGEKEGCAFNDQWNAGGVNGKLGEKEGVLILPTCCGGGTGKPMAKGDVIMMSCAVVFVKH
jgi:hypothetical protein